MSSQSPSSSHVGAHTCCAVPSSHALPVDTTVTVLPQAALSLRLEQSAFRSQVGVQAPLAQMPSPQSFLELQALNQLVLPPLPTWPPSDCAPQPAAQPNTASIIHRSNALMGVSCLHIDQTGIVYVLPEVEGHGETLRLRKGMLIVVTTHFFP